MLANGYQRVIKKAGKILYLLTADFMDIIVRCFTLMKYRSTLISSGRAMAALLTFATTSLATAKDKEPLTIQDSVSDAAVSEVNGKLDATYGKIDDTYTRGLFGSLSLPVGHTFGVQFDGLYAHANDDDFYGAAGHFFARKPEQGLIGVALGGLYSGDIESYVAVVEGEYYFDKVTLGGYAGYNNVQTDIRFPTFNTDLRDENNFAVLNLYAAVYPIENLMVKFEYANRVERNFYSVQVEYQTPVRGLSVFVDAGVGDHHYSHLLGGLRYYFGSDKTLKSRHRHDDPPNILNGMEQGSVAGAGNEAAPQPASLPPT